MNNGPKKFWKSWVHKNRPIDPIINRFNNSLNPYSISFVLQYESYNIHHFSVRDGVYD